MKQFLLREDPDREGLVRLRGGDYHYLVRVRRLRPGGGFDAALPDGEAVSVTILAVDGEVHKGRVSPRTADGAVPGPEGIRPVRPPPLVLFQALPGGAKMDLIVRQAAEGGVDEVAPFVSERSAGRPPPDRAARMAERWRRIVREARQQSGSGVDTRIHPLMTAEELFAYWEGLKVPPLKPARGEALGLVCRPGPLVQGGFHRYLDRELSLAALAVGPEGGFSAAELDRFTGAGFKPVSLGDTVLRTETAALYGTAALRIILMEKARWTLNERQIPEPVPDRP
ncbi:MAG: 16S rRNA (uracil(1498)-N(3))-methyltransferase [Treponema sp.]|jgi:16S rRNA (uracil1498-N3)-methyltransferase|nr:16S rRNA (uracil(1498)-N(3))-methyltransferase [Treponema sp.]